MSRFPLWGVVPVKPFASAKRRLAGVLTDGERLQLARIMLDDVLGALVSGGGLLAGILVLTADAEAAAVARRAGAQVVVEPSPGGINAALALAVACLAGAPEAGMLVVPSDLPHLSTNAIEQIAGCLERPRSMAVVPATADGGTNVLACRPAGIISPSFGPRSFVRHCSAARRAGLALTVLQSAHLGRDLDRPADLLALLSFAGATRTRTFLSGLAIVDRLQASRPPREGWRAEDGKGERTNHRHV